MAIVVLGLAVLMTSATAFVTTSSGAPRGSPAHRAVETARDVAGADEATAAPKLVVGERDFETFVGRYVSETISGPGIKPLRNFEPIY